MAVVTQDKVFLVDRKYPDHNYTVWVYTKTQKVNIAVLDNAKGATLKMSRREAEELITRLTYALHTLDNPEVTP